MLHQCTGVVWVNFSKCTPNGLCTLTSASLVLFTFGTWWTVCISSGCTYYLIEAARHFLRMLIQWDILYCTENSRYWFIALVICYLKSRVEVLNNRLTHHSRSGKHDRLGLNITGTRGMPRGRSLRSIHFIWFLTTWVTVENSSKCVFVLISMLGKVKKKIATILLVYTYGLLLKKFMKPLE